MSINNGTDIVTYPAVLIYNGQKYAFDPHNVEYSLPKVTQHGGYKVTCTYKISDNLRVPIVIQTPVMTSTFGLSTAEHDGTLKASVDVTFDDKAGSDVASFKRVMCLWDSLLLQMAKDNKERWFKSTKISDEILDYLFIPTVRENVRKSDGQKFFDSIKGKVKQKNDQFICEVFGKDKSRIKIEDLGRQSMIRMLLVQSGVWFSESMFVSSFDCPQIQMVASGRLSGFSFVDDNNQSHENLVI